MEERPKINYASPILFVLSGIIHAVFIGIFLVTFLIAYFKIKSWDVIIVVSCFALYTVMFLLIFALGPVSRFIKDIVPDAAFVAAFRMPKGVKITSKEIEGLITDLLELNVLYARILSFATFTVLFIAISLIAVSSPIISKWFEMLVAPVSFGDAFKFSIDQFLNVATAEFPKVVLHKSMGSLGQNESSYALSALVWSYRFYVASVVVAAIIPLYERMRRAPR